MPLIRITKSRHEGRIPLTLNDERFTLHSEGDPARSDGLTDVPKQFLPLLNDSHIEYEIVEPKGSGKGAAGAEGSKSDAAPTTVHVPDTRTEEELKAAGERPQAEKAAPAKAEAPKRKTRKSK